MKIVAPDGLNAPFSNIFHDRLSRITLFEELCTISSDYVCTLTEEHTFSRKLQKKFKYISKTFWKTSEKHIFPCLLHMLFRTLPMCMGRKVVTQQPREGQKYRCSICTLSGLLCIFASLGNFMIRS